MNDSWPYTTNLRPNRRSTGLTVDGKRSRDEILTILRQTTEPLTTREVADRMTRGLGWPDAHLAALTNQGFVKMEWSTERRPVKLWSMAEDCPACGRPLRDE